MQATVSPNPRVTLVPADANDFDALLALRIAAMRESLERVGRFDPVRARERLLSGFSPRHTEHIVVARERVGFVVVKPSGGGLLLDHLYIKPDRQGQGVGGEVLSHLFTIADHEALDIRVGALRDSDSNRFYLRHGFILVEQTAFDNHYLRSSRGAL